MSADSGRKTVAECRRECDLAGGNEHSELEVVYTQRAVVRRGKTVADYMNEIGRASCRERVCLVV